MLLLDGSESTIAIAQLAASQQSVKAHEGVYGLNGIPMVGNLAINNLPGIGDYQPFAIIAAVRGFYGYVRMEDDKVTINVYAFNIVRILGELTSKILDKVY